MESNATANSSDFKAVADKIFETLLTITTILSGVYVSIAFSWFGSAMMEPHPGGPMKPEMLTQATIGIILGLTFILPLISILMAWAFSRFRNSLTWRTVAWSGLIYCLTQDFIGIVALFGITLIVTGALIGDTLIAAGVFVILPPCILGAVLGYRISLRHSDGMTVEPKKRRHALTALATVIFLLIIQGLLVLSLFTF